MIGMITNYTLTMSPRYDELVMIAEAPDNVVGYLVPRKGEAADLPGLRVESIIDSTFLLVHLPTGARMRVTPDKSTQTFATPGKYDQDEWLRPTVPLSEREQQAMDSESRLPGGIAEIVMGMLVRINLRDPHSRWSGSWFYDQLRFPDRDMPHGQNRRQLSGHGTEWLMRWSGHPYPSDLGRLLTDPVAGIPGVQIAGDVNRIELTLRGSTLRMRHFDLTDDPRERHIMPAAQGR